MQHRNIWKQSILGEIESADIVDSMEGVITNAGVAVEYYPFSSYTNTFGEKLDTYAFIQSKEDITSGVFKADRKLEVIMPTKVFTENSITPSDKDKIVINNSAYYIKSIVFYGRNKVSTDLIENSILVTFTATKREGFTRNNLVS